MRDAVFTTGLPVTSALSARLTAFAAPERSSLRTASSKPALPNSMAPSSSTLDAINLSSLDTGGGIGRRVGWKNRPGLFGDSRDAFLEIGLTQHDW